MNRQSGVSLSEALVVVALVGIAAGVTALYLRPAGTPLQSATYLLQGRLRQARQLAMASTSAYRVFPIATSRTGGEFAPNCAATTWTDDPGLELELPAGVTMTSTAWSACFSSRGISQTNISIKLIHADYGTVTVELLLGGTTRTLP